MNKPANRQPTDKPAPANGEDLEALGRAIDDALARRDLRAARALMVRRAHAAIELAHALERTERAKRRKLGASWPRCGAPRTDGEQCQARTLWLDGEATPRTRCRLHGGERSPNAPRIRPTSAAE